jgi:MFS family permease
MLARLDKIYHEFPKKFWIIAGVSFIDRVGGTLLFPFFSLYITQRFNVGMAEAGIILGLFSVFGLVGNMIGGALADRFGRRSLILFGLVASAVSTLGLGLVNSYAALFPMAVVIGLLTDIAGPAHNALLADILPEKQRQEGFGILRVVGNLAWMIGPTIGGFVATKSFFALFVMDAVISCVVAVLFYRFMPETKPAPQAGHARENTLQSFQGYTRVLRDFAFLAFMTAGMLMGVVYQQMYSSLSVYLRDVHGISSQGYGFLLTTSAITVILLQFWMLRTVKRRPPFAMMAIGTIFYAVGFSMFGFVSAYWMFALAVVVITMGEMILMPVSQALAANFAPAEMRGRYMAVYSLVWMLPAAVGPGAAGYILDTFNPNWLWYIGGVLCLLSTVSYWALHLRLGPQKRFAPASPEAAGESLAA